MTIKKPTYKELEAQVKKLERMEPAIWHTYNRLDEIFALMVMAREYAKSEKASKHTTANGIDAIFTNLISLQSDLMDNSGLEY